MRGAPVAAALAAAVALASPARAEEHWERMVVGRLASLPPAVARIWASEAPAAAAGPVDVAYAVFPAGDLAVVVSVVFDGAACGRPGSVAPEATCPARADVVGVDRRPATVPDACFVPTSLGWSEGDPQASGAWASLDPATGTVRLAASRDGVRLPACDRTMSLR